MAGGRSGVIFMISIHDVGFLERKKVGDIYHGCLVKIFANVFPMSSNSLYQYQHYLLLVKKNRENWENVKCAHLSFFLFFAVTGVKYYYFCHFSLIFFRVIILFDRE